MEKIRIVETTVGANDSSVLKGVPVYRVFVGDIELSGLVVSIESTLQPNQYVSVKLEFLTDDFKFIDEDDLLVDN